MVTKDARPRGLFTTFRGHARNRPLKVMLTAITLWSFLLSGVTPIPHAWAAKTSAELAAVGSEKSGAASLSGEQTRIVDAETFSIPEYLGTIRDYWKTAGSAADGEAPITIIHIQDAHCNYEGQKRIAEIMEYVNTNYGITTANLEGGVQDYDLSPITDITDAEIRKKVADYFVRDGRVNGAEYCAINSPDKINLWGVEDTRLYIDNLGIYRESLAHKAEVEKYLGILGSVLTNLKIKSYPKDLLELDAKYIQYKASNLDFKDYLSYLIGKAQEKAVDIKPLTSIYLLNQTLAEEEKIDFKQANNEREDLIDKLQKKLARRTVEDLVVKTVDYKAGRLSQRDFYSYLIEKAKSINMDLAAYPELQRYIVYVSMYSAIDKLKIMGEITTLETQLKETMFTDPVQRELDVLSKNLALLKNMFNISLTKDDYRYYLDKKETFDMRRYLDFIRREAPRAQLDFTIDDGIEKIDAYREDIAKFYGYSFERDVAFLKNMKTEGRGTKTAMMVTGGFHTENLCELFRKNKINYVSIMPNFKNKPGYQSPYFDLLAGQETGIERAIDAAGSAMQLYSMLNRLGIEIAGQAEGIRFRRAIAIMREFVKNGEAPCYLKNDKTGTAVTISLVEGTVSFAEGKLADVKELIEKAEPVAIDAGLTLYATKSQAAAPALQKPKTAEEPQAASTMAYVDALAARDIALAEPIYRTAFDSARVIVDYLNRNVKTFDLSPAPLEDVGKTAAINKTASRTLNMKGFGVTADSYRFGNGEDWYANMLSRLNPMLGQFAAEVHKGENTARFAIRIMAEKTESLNEKTRKELLDHIRKQLAETFRYDTTAVDAIVQRIRIISIDVREAKHLNPVPDLLADILAMEFDRYVKEDYPKTGDKPVVPEQITEQLARMLNMTADIPELSKGATETMGEFQDRIRDFMNRLYEGERLKIRAIDWKSIDEWRRSQDSVLQAV